MNRRPENMVFSPDHRTGGDTIIPIPGLGRSQTRLEGGLVYAERKNRAHLDALFEPRVKKHGLYDRLDFRQEFEGYSARLMSPGYMTTLQGFAAQVGERLAGLGKLPDVWVAIPSRNETQTAKAVEAVLTECGRQVTPFFFIFHNYTKAPSAETAEDILKVSQMPNVYLIEMPVDQNEVMGDIRGFVTDVALMTAYESHDPDPIIASTDADITRYSRNHTFRRVLDTFRHGSKNNPQIDAVVITEKPDITLFAPNRQIFIEELIKDAFSDNELRSITYQPATAGRCAFIRGSSICAAGSYLPLDIAEDLTLINGLIMVRGRANHTACLRYKPKFTVFYDPRKERLAETREDYYSRWLNLRGVEKPEVKPDDALDDTRLLYVLVRSFMGSRTEIMDHQGFHANIDQTFQNCCQIFLELHRLMTKLRENRVSDKELIRRFTTGLITGDKDSVMNAANLFKSLKLPDHSFTHT
ncbi:hypothetical protein HY338_03125 [Candidatus Gottesmanbacteria bacterium]|nr:hypothetical protein [Candidatus Gottesmanbacteria bacterium]